MGGAGKIPANGSRQPGIEAVRMAALHDLAVAAGLGGTERHLAKITVDGALRVARGDTAVLRWFDPVNQGFRLVASSGAKNGLPGEIGADINTAIAWAFKDRKPVIDNDYASSGRATEWGRRQGIQAQVAVPLLVEGRAVGTLAVISFSPKTFVPRDGLVLSLLAAIIAPALEAARLKHEVRRRDESVKESELLFSAAFEASGIGMALTDLDGRVVRINPTLCEMLGYGEQELTDIDPRTMLEPDDLGAFIESLRGPYRDAGSTVVAADSRIIRKDGGRIWARVTASMIRRDGAPYRVLVHVVDVTDERRAEFILRSEQDRLSEIIEAQRDIAGVESDFERLLTVLAERTVRLTGVGGVTVLVPRGDEMVVRAIAGASSDLGLGLALPIEGSLAGLSYRTGEVQRVADAWHDPKPHANTARRINIRSMVSTPILNGEKVMGVLQLMSMEPDAFDETDVRTVRMIAGFAGAAFERASTAARLKDSERRTRAVIESAPYPIVIFDTRDGAMVEFNPAAEAAFGRSRAEAAGAPATILLPARAAVDFRRWLDHGDTAGSAEYAGRSFETQAIRADGTEFPIEVAIADLPEPTRLAAAFMRDLSLRDRLKESKGRLAAVISQAPVILFACDTTGKVTLSEGQGLATLGIKTEDIVGHRLQELLAGQPDGLWHLERALKGESFSGQIHLSLGDGAPGEVFLEGTYGPIRDEHGVSAGVSAILTNVTDRVRAESAQRESEAKSRLMAIMNHEVRTPLNSILGFTHLLKQPRVGQLNELQLRYLSNVEVSGKQLLDLINDSLDLAKLNAGHPAIKLEDLKLGDVLERAADQVRPGALDHGLAAVVEPCPGLMVRADERLLTQVVLNLLSNAIRHTPAGGTVSMGARPGVGVVAIVVRDTGVGIPKEDLERIFDEFYQSANHAVGGTGLGLTITRRLVQLMHGAVVADSELGKGSTFTVTLPAGRG